MLIVILCVIIMAYLFYDNMYGSSSKAFFGGVLGFVVGFCLYISLGGFIGSVLKTIDVTEKKELYALNDLSSIEGSYYVFSGYIDEKLVYRYVEKTEKGLHIEEINSSNVYIKEGDYIPTLVIHKKEFASEWMYLFAHDYFFTTEYEFLVPANTVITEYNIDLK